MISEDTIDQLEDEYGDEVVLPSITVIEIIKEFFEIFGKVKEKDVIEFSKELKHHPKKHKLFELFGEINQHANEIYSRQEVILNGPKYETEYVPKETITVRKKVGIIPGGGFFEDKTPDTPIYENQTNVYGGYNKSYLKEPPIYRYQLKQIEEKTNEIFNIIINDLFKFAYKKGYIADLNENNNKREIEEENSSKVDIDWNIIEKGKKWKGICNNGLVIHITKDINEGIRGFRDKDKFYICYVTFKGNILTRPDKETIYRWLFPVRTERIVTGFNLNEVKEKMKEQIKNNIKYYHQIINE